MRHGFGGKGRDILADNVVTGVCTRGRRVAGSIRHANGTRSDATNLLAQINRSKELRETRLLMRTRNQVDFQCRIRDSGIIALAVSCPRGRRRKRSAVGAMVVLVRLVLVILRPLRSVLRAAEVAGSILEREMNLGCRRHVIVSIMLMGRMSRHVEMAGLLAAWKRTTVMRGRGNMIRRCRPQTIVLGSS